MGNNMRTLGLIGGTNWQGTREYYRIINEGVNDALGGFHSARLFMHSFDFAEIKRLLELEDWDTICRILIQAAQGLERSGAEGVMVCNNTLHRVIEDVEAAISIPVIRLTDAMGEAATRNEHRKVGLLSSDTLMMCQFYRNQLEKKYGLEIIIPNREERAEIHRIIYEVLCQGRYPNAERQVFLDTIDKLGERGAQGILLACNEIGTLIQQPMTTMPIYASLPIHCQAAIDFILKREHQQAAA